MYFFLFDLIFTIILVLRFLVFNIKEIVLEYSLILHNDQSKSKFFFQN